MYNQTETEVAENLKRVNDFCIRAKISVFEEMLIKPVYRKLEKLILRSLKKNR